MVEQNPDLAELLGRRLSYEIVMLHTAVGEHLGLGLIDHKYLDLIDREGPLAAGQLAELTGLSTGAVTAVLDRLEAGDFISRYADPTDRRRVLTAATPSARARIGALMSPLGQRTAPLLAKYSADELAAIASFIDELLDAVHLTRQEIQGR